MSFRGYFVVHIQSAKSRTEDFRVAWKRIELDKMAQDFQPPPHHRIVQSSAWLCPGQLSKCKW
jgi:hypothetical protein